jgi:hypothetical protein
MSASANRLAEDIGILAIVMPVLGKAADEGFIDSHNAHGSFVSTHIVWE